LDEIVAELPRGLPITVVPALLRKRHSVGEDIDHAFGQRRVEIGEPDQDVSELVYTNLAISAWCAARMP